MGFVFRRALGRACSGQTGDEIGRVHFLRGGRGKRVREGGRGSEREREIERDRHNRRASSLG